MAIYDLGTTLTSWQQGDALRRLYALTPPVEGSINGQLLTTSRDLTGPEWTGVQNVLPTILALPDPQLAEASGLDAIVAQWNAINLSGINGSRTPTNVYTAVLAELNAVTTNAQAITFLKRWIPFIVAVLYWVIVRAVKAQRNL